MEMREGDSGKIRKNGRHNGVKHEERNVIIRIKFQNAFPMSSPPTALRPVFGPWPPRSPSSNLVTDDQVRNQIRDVLGSETQKLRLEE
jgi:hypothetical protein